MKPCEQEIQTSGAHSRPPALHERVAQVYYSHGLFSSSYPITVLTFAISVALLCCYPLVNFPLPGNLPLQIWETNNHTNADTQHEAPLCYVQQIVVRTAVVPWGPGMNVGDAYRAPLYEAFKLLEVTRNYKDLNSSKTLDHLCLHVEAIKKYKDMRNNILPQYSCLTLSPANFWHQDVEEFAQDTSLVNTIFTHQNLQKGKTSVAEMLFGMHLIDTGVKRYPFRNRQRILQYAVTLFLKENDIQFIAGLRNKLKTLYPLHQTLNLSENTQSIYNETVYIYYPGEFNYTEFAPISFTFCLLFMYYYFSVRKIELIKSKLGMACTVVVTVLGSLGMTLGICFFFGLTLSMQGKEIFPYLIVLVGLENVLVLTKSVAATPLHLDVKIRVAQGLSKEGWSITKNLFIELTILTVGLSTFVPAIQEFCVFTIAGLITDFFLQMLFFSTMLGIDVRRMENLVEKTNYSFRNSLYQSRDYYDKSSNYSPKTGMNRSKSHPRLNSAHTNIVAGQGVQEKKIPKRLRLVNIWARTRFFQRAFMVLMVVWIGRILYDSGIIEHYFLELTEKNAKKESEVFPNENVESVSANYNPFKSPLKFSLNKSYADLNFVTQRTQDFALGVNHTDELNKLKHLDYAPWLHLSTQHWPAILRKYNISLSGRSIAVLPNIKISYAVGPERAVLLRNPNEKYTQKFEWQALALALDPIDFGRENDLETTSRSLNFMYFDRPLYPTSPMEIFLTTLLCVISVIVLAYAFVVLYRCVCSRNYAEWRASWWNEKTEESEVPVLLEAVPIILEGHPQEIECVATDGFSVASSCLGGQIKVWDAATGELLAKIDRKLYFSGSSKSPDISIDFDENNLSDYESGSPPSRDETLASFPSLQHKINTNFTGLKLQPVENQRQMKYDFGSQYKQIYLQHRKDAAKTKSQNSDTIKWVQHQREIDKSDYEVHNSDYYEKPDSSPCSDKLHTNKFDVSDGTNLVAQFSDSVNNICAASSARASPIWCMDYLDNLIAIGCSNGRLEFWEGTTGKFKCMFEDGSGIGVTSVKVIGSRVIAARLYGSLDFLQLQTYSQGRPIDWNFTSAYRRTHVRAASAGSIVDIRDILNHNDSIEDMRCIKVFTTKAHQQPITCLDSEGGRVLTGSQDHTLRVFRIEDGNPLYTLHGHCGPITCLFIDRVCPATSGSGSQDGMLCVWDLLTGTCMYSIQAHDGSVTSLTYSASYVISLGSDERLCVWERFQGHLLNTIQISHTFPSHVVMLTPHLIITTRSGNLVVWDVRSGENVRTIVLGHSPFVFIKQMLMLRDAVLCDFGNQLRIVRFPLITHKFD